VKGSRPRDWLLLGVLFPIWAVCFAASLSSIGDPPLIPLVSVRAGGAGEYPIVVDLSRWVRPGETDLAPDDRLVRVGSTDLRGVGALGYWARFQVEAEYGRPVSLAYERGGRRGETQLPVHIRVPFGLHLPLACAAVGLLLSLRAPASRLARATSRAFLVAALAYTGPIAGSVALNHVGLAQIALAQALSLPVTLRAMLRFPDGELPRRAGIRLAPWLFAAMGPFATSALANFPLNLHLGGVLWQLGNLAGGVVILALVAYEYRRAAPVPRRQLRWLVLGFCAASLPSAVVLALMLLDRLLYGELQRLYPALWMSGNFVILIPVSVFFAVARYNLFDVDRILSAAASYNAVLVVGIAIGLVVVPRLAEAASSLVGVDPGTGQVALSLALAALVVPAHRRLRPRIDRLFFRERAALDRGIGELLASLSSCAGARELTERVGEGIVRLFRPDACVVYAAVGEGYEPIFAEGRAVPPAFEASSLLVQTLRARRGPLSLSDAGRRPDAAALDPFDRAALQTLAAEVVVPVRREELAAFLCLGPKRSGDVYTPTDLSLLTAVAETVSRELRRLEQEAVLREARELQHSLRRYVPGAVAEELAGGRDLASGERCVSVLFVDMRGYTSFAERRTAEEVFSTLNAYTEKVSRIVGARGGTIVEFHGDGLLAVFGAPRALEGKERAAVEAAREVVGALAGAIDVGIGIATGLDFVGNIRGADRMIWSVVGNTTNLAARLQALTRELDAAIAVDAATHEAAGYVCADFAKHEGVRIRGRSEPQDVWALPLAAPP
jgi:class 3 adenylate cyclase